MKVNMEERQKFFKLSHSWTFAVRFLPGKLSPFQFASVFWGPFETKISPKTKADTTLTLSVMAAPLYPASPHLAPPTHSLPSLQQTDCHSSFHWKPLWPKSIMTSLSLNSMDIFLSPSYPTALQDLTWLTTLLLLKVFPPSVSMTTPPGFLPPWAFQSVCLSSPPPPPTPPPRTLQIPHH